MTDDPKPKRAPVLGANALQRADIVRGNFIAIVPSDTTFEQVMTPAYWANHVAALGMAAGARPFARIEVIREDGTMDLELRVLGVKPGMVRVNCLRKWINNENLTGKADESDKTPAADLSLPDGYKWAFVPQGGNKGHLVRLPTGEILVQGLPSKAVAAKAARDHYAEANAAPADSTITPATEPA